MNNLGVTDVLSASTSELISILSKMVETDKYAKQIDAVASEIVGSYRSGGKILFCGNGGSAAESQHMAAEYVATLNSKNMRPSLPAIALTVDTSFLTAWSNDFNTSELFSRQIESLGRPEDVLVVYSTSGNSENIVLAVKKANEMGIKTIALLGNNGGKIRLIADISIIVESNSTPRIQEIHTLCGHSICRTVELKLGY